MDRRTQLVGLSKTLLLAVLVSLVCVVLVAYEFRVQRLALMLQSPTLAEVQKLSARATVLPTSISCACTRSSAPLRHLNTSVSLQWNDWCDLDYESDQQASTKQWQQWCLQAENEGLDPMCHDPFGVKTGMRIFTKDVDRFCVHLRAMIAHRKAQLLAGSVFSASLLTDTQLQHVLDDMLAAQIDQYRASVVEQHSFIRYWEYISRPILGTGWRPSAAVLKGRPGIPYADKTTRSSTGVDVRTQIISQLGGYGGTRYLTTEELVRNSSDAEPDLFLLTRRQGWEGWAGTHCEWSWDGKSRAGAPCSAFDTSLNRPKHQLTLLQQRYGTPLADVEIDGLLDEWSVHADYASYFAACAPSSCSYLEDTRVDYWSGLLKVMSNIGGAVTVISFVVNFIVNAITAAGDKAAEHHYKKVDQQD